MSDRIGPKWVLGAAAVVISALWPVLATPEPAQAGPPAPTCDDSWIAPGGGFWTTNADWSTGLPPTSGQYACVTIPLSAGAPLVVNGTDTVAGLTIGGPTGTTNVKIVGGLTLGSNSSVTANGIVNGNTGAIVMASGATLTNDGTVEETSNWQLSGNFTNDADGLLEVTAGDAMAYDTGTLTNQGTVFIQSQGLLRTPASGQTAVIDNAGGVIYDEGPNNSVGTVDVGPGATFEQGNGDVVGNSIYLGFPAGGALDITGNGSGTFLLQSGATLTGNVAAGQTVYADGVTATGSFTNAGTLMGGGGVSLALPSGATLTNTGAIDPSPGTTLTIAGNVVNEPGGTISMNSSQLALSGAVTLTNDGTITVSPNSALGSGTAGTLDNDGGTITNGGAVNVNQGATFVEGDGSTTGNSVAVNGALHLTGGGASSFQMVNGTNTINGDVAAGQIVEMRSTLNASGSFTNNGTIIGNGGTLVLPSGDTLTNNGTISFGHGGGGSGGFVVDGNVTNSVSGVMGVQGAEFSMGEANTTFDNEGTLYLLFSTGLDFRAQGTCGGSGQQVCDINWSNSGTIYWGVDSQGSQWGGFGLASNFNANTGDVVNLGGTIIPVPVGEPASSSGTPPTPTISYGIGGPTMPPGTSTPTWSMSCGAAVTSGWSVACPDYTALWQYYGTTLIPTDVNLSSTGNENTFGWTSTYGQPVTVTATVSAQDGSAPTGTVAFYAPQQSTATPDELRPDLLGTAPLTTTGGVTTATLTANLPPGQYDLMAFYLGDTTHMAGSTQYGNVTTGQPEGGAQTVSQQTSAVAATSSGSPTGFGSPLTFTATVTPGAPAGPAAPSGVVTFDDAGVPFATAPLITSGGVTTAQVTTANLPPGSPDSITAIYGGDYNYSGSTTSSAWSQTVTTTQPQLISFAAPSSGVVNGSAPLSPTATSGLGVTLTVDSTTIPSGACTLSGTPGSYSVNFVHAGTCVLDANQAGNTSYAPAVQQQQTITISRATQTVTFTSVAPSSTTVGATPYTPTATASSGLDVTISLDGASSGCALDSGSGVVSFTAPGTCLIDANQGGNADYLAAAQVQQTITVKSAAALVLVPSAGAQNTTFSAEATGFVADEMVSISFDGIDDGSCTTDASGACNAAASVPVSLPAGSYSVDADGVDGDSASSSFTITPALSLSPSSGPQGSTFSASATGFAASEAVSIDFDGSVVGSCTADTTGDCTATMLTVPGGVSAGNYTVTATGQSSALVATAVFAETPSLGLVPSSGQAGSSFDADAVGFGAGETVDFAYGGTPEGSCPADPTGACTVSITVPSGSGGPYTIEATGETSGEAATAVFTETPTLVLVPPSGAQNAPFNAEASGFASAEVVSISFDGIADGSCTTDSNGECTAASTVPASLPAGSYSVEADGANGDSTSSSFTITPALSLSPSSGPPGSTFSASATGFAANEMVSISFNGVVIGSCSAVATGDCTAGSLTVPSGVAAGVYTVTATGQTSGLSASAPFTASGRPTVTAVSPTAGPTAGGTLVTITGTNFVTGASVHFGTGSATGVTVIDASHISANAPAGTGTVNITVTTPGGTSATSTADRYTYDPVPTVSALSPSAGPLAGTNTVTIIGTGFVSGASVSFGTTAATGVTLVNGSHLTATAPAGTGTVDVTVTTPGGTSATSTADHYTYDAVPTVSAVSPNAGRLSGGTAVTITGTNFVTGASVHFGTAPATKVTVVGPSTITATSPAGTAGTVDVTVTTPGGTSATSSSDLFTYDTAPTVTAVSPTAGPTAGGTLVTITGTNFVTGASVHFGTGSATGVTVIDASHISANAPAGTGTVNITVTTPGGTSATSTADRYTYDPVPTVSALSPSAGPLAGTNTVTIIGTGFVSGASVSFGTTAATGVTLVNGSHLTATAPAGTGTVDVTVTTPGGTSATSTADHYTYDAVPTVSAVSPNAGRLSGGTAVTITGTNFVTGASVHFGTAPATKVTVVGPSTITATSPAGTAGTVDVTVTTPGGTSATSSSDLFTYDTAPTVTAVSPTAGPTAGGTLVTITGTNFVTGASVHFGTGSATGVTVIDASHISANAPAGTGTVNITVTTPGGTSATSTADRYTYH